MIEEKLMNIQNELKAPKGQKNTFGKYNYRSCEDILEATKPLLIKYKSTLTISDDLVLIGDRYYIKATATLRDIEKKEDTISNTAFARESLEKKGMDESQITGTASSYARKYALNGLFCIDDTKDADTNEFKEQTDNFEDTITETEAQALVLIIKDNNLDINNEFLKTYKKYGYNKTIEIKQKDYKKIVDELKGVMTY